MLRGCVRGWVGVDGLWLGGWARYATSAQRMRNIMQRMRNITQRSECVILCNECVILRNEWCVMLRNMHVHVHHLCM